jgi:hypothetical protein
MIAAIAFWLTVFGSLCWPVCFWWMHRISTKQEATLKALMKQAKRIEQLSKAEHDLIKDVHPEIGEIRKGIEDVKTVAERHPRG